MEARSLVRALVRGAGAVALCGGAVVAAAGAASATETSGTTASSVNDCRDFAEMWGVGEDSPSYTEVHDACREGAWGDPSKCRYEMQRAIWEHNHDDSQRPVPYWVGDEACRRAP